jgi:hypothetical protein
MGTQLGSAWMLIILFIISCIALGGARTIPQDLGEEHLPSQRAKIRTGPEVDITIDTSVL